MSTFSTLATELPSFLQNGFVMFSNSQLLSLFSLSVSSSVLGAYSDPLSDSSTLSYWYLP